MMLLVNNLHEKRIIEGQDGRIIGSARAFILVATLHSCHMKNTIVFSQSDACDFFHLYYHLTKEICRNVKVVVKLTCFLFEGMVI